MKAAKAFFDSNVLLYLLSADSRKANQAETLLVGGGTISVQVLNEFASVATRKFKMSYPEVREALQIVKAVCQIHPLTVDTHQQGLDIAERYGFSWYDSLIVSAALTTGCDCLYSEDMPHGQIIDSQLRIVNPFTDLPA
jgi:predicted nucleic acid-binding protein